MPSDQTIDFVVAFLSIGLLVLGLGSVALGWLLRQWDRWRGVKTFEEAPAHAMSSTAADDGRTATDGRADGRADGDPRGCAALQLDRSKEGLIRVLVYNGWKVEEIRRAVKGENEAIGKAIQSARDLDDDAIRTPIAGRVTRKSYYPDDPDLEYQAP